MRIFRSAWGWKNRFPLHPNFTHPVREVPRWRLERLKYQIRERLKRTDYRCRLPDARHPVIRHKLRLHVRELNRFGFKTYTSPVYK